ncbi:MAG TPA: hypothetical protein VJS88_09250 [Chthoniobacterales bacterium]|nr:hypothetical protein [Chthoniobacterales bacterium]
MFRHFAVAGLFLFATALGAQEELPKDPGEPMDIEPPLLIQEAPNRNVVYTRPDAAEPGPADPDRIAQALEKAKKSAASGERLYKSGIIAKVEAENRVLKVVRLEADLAEARLELAKQDLSLQEARLEAGEISEADLRTAQRALAAATGEAESAVAAKKKAELDAATLNLQRQKKLLAMGSGRKAEVSRAQEKVAALQEQE